MEIYNTYEEAAEAADRNSRLFGVPVSVVKLINGKYALRTEGMFQRVWVCDE